MLGPGKTNKASALDQVQHQLLFDTVPQGVIFHDAEGRVMVMNPAAERILGRPPEELTDDPSSEEHGTIREDGSPFPGSEHPSMVSMRTGREVSDVVMGVYNPREREYRWISITAVPLFRPGEDRPYQVYTLFQDVTRQRRAEQALRECKLSRQVVEVVKAERNRLFDVLDTLPVMICLITPDYGIVFANRAFREKFGESHDRRCYEYCFGQPGPCAFCQSFRVLETGKPHRWEVSHSDGSIIDVYDFPFRDADGSPMVLEMDVDITDVRRSQREAEEQGRCLQLILDNTPVAIGITDEKGGIVVDNGVLGKIWCGNLSLNEVADYAQCKAWWPETGELVRPEEWPAARALKGEASTATLDIERNDGSRGALIVSATPIKDAAGEVTGTVWTNQDITDLRRTEQDLKRSNAELQQFAYVASHDLQEPLRMVTNFLQLIEARERGNLDGTSRKYMGYAVEGAKRMKAMIDDILTYSRVESKGGSLEPVDMEKVLSIVLKDLNLAISESGASVTHDALPMVEADRGQVSLLMKNLVGNAIKYRSEAAPQVHLSACRSDGEWVFSIEDNGIGIEPRYSEKLFKMFSRLHTRDEYEGTGMGLAISKKIVERHGGRIWFESEPGRGSTFYFSMPLAGGSHRKRPHQQ